MTWALAKVLQPPGVIRKPHTSFPRRWAGCLLVVALPGSLDAGGRPAQAVPCYSCLRSTSLHVSFKTPGTGSKMDVSDYIRLQTATLLLKREASLRWLDSARRSHGWGFEADH